MEVTDRMDSCLLVPPGRSSDRAAAQGYGGHRRGKQQGQTNTDPVIGVGAGQRQEEWHSAANDGY